MSWQDQLQPNFYLRSLFDSLPINNFVDLSKLESFHSRYTTLLLMLRTSIPTLPITFQLASELPFGRLQLVNCGGIAMGYLLSAPRCNKKVGRNYAFVSRSEHTDKQERLFVDGKLCIVGNEFSMLATIQPKYWLDRL